MSSPLAIYLRNHEAAAQAGRDLFRRAASSQRQQPYATDLQQLLVEVRTDLRSLRDIMRRHGVSPSPALAIALRLGERAGRLKPNGTLIQRSPLSDLIEVEGLLDAVRAKEAGWQALGSAADPVQAAEYDVLGQRAAEQILVLTDIHRKVAARVLDLG